MVKELGQLSFQDSIIVPSKMRAHVRFSPEEYKKISKDSKIFKKSISWLLRQNYFKRLPTNVLLGVDDFKLFQRQYQGIANNLNQLTKRVHLGFPLPEKSILELSERTNELFFFVSSKSGNGQSKV